MIYRATNMYTKNQNILNDINLHLYDLMNGLSTRCLEKKNDLIKSLTSMRFY